jgi:hypothetical protein
MKTDDKGERIRVRVRVRVRVLGLGLGLGLGLRVKVKVKVKVRVRVRGDYPNRARIPKNTCSVQNVDASGWLPETIFKNSESKVHCVYSRSTFTFISVLRRYRRAIFLSVRATISAST